MSLEEQRQRQEDEAKRAQQASLEGTGSQPEQQQEEPVGMDTGGSVLASALSRDLPSGGGITVADGPMVRDREGDGVAWGGGGVMGDGAAVEVGAPDIGRTDLWTCPFLSIRDEVGVTRDREGGRGGELEERG